AVAAAQAQPAAQPGSAGTDVVPVDARPNVTVDAQLCAAELQVTSASGAVSHVDLTNFTANYDVTPVWSWALDGFPMPYSAYGGDPGPEELLSAQALGFVAGAGPLDAPGAPVEFVEQSPNRIVTRSVSADGVEITRTLSATGDSPCVWTLDVTWRNASASASSVPLW